MSVEWVPIALGRDVPAGATRGVILEGRELVAWRGADGEAHVWEDRCPHRGMRLSLGFVRGNALNCLYHGWSYGSGGGCQRIPAHPDLNVPGSIRADVRIAAEARGMIWTRASGNGDAPLPQSEGGAPLCSLAVASEPAAILGLAGASPVAGLQLFSLQHAGAQIHIGWHRVCPGKTMLHAVTDGGDAHAALRLLRGLRSEAEGRAAA